MAIVSYPATLPPPSRAGYQLNNVSTTRRTTTVSGRERVRRVFAAAPSMITINWIFTASQLRRFMSWFADDIDHGASWFTMKLKVGDGLSDAEVRFAAMYQLAPANARDWQVQAQIETRARNVVDQNWVLYAPDAIVYANADMPYAAIIDTAINNDWPSQ